MAEDDLPEGYGEARSEAKEDAAKPKKSGKASKATVAEAAVEGSDMAAQENAPPAKKKSARAKAPEEAASDEDAAPPKPKPKRASKPKSE